MNKETLIYIALHKANKPLLKFQRKEFNLKKIWYFN